MMHSIKTNIDRLSVELKEDGLFYSPLAWRNRGARFGLPSYDLPHRFKGSELSAEQMAHIFRYVGEKDLVLRDIPGAGHGLFILDSNMNQEQEDLIHRISEGKEFIAIAITEDTGGSDIRNVLTKAIPVDSGYILSGKKAYTARLREATSFIVLAKIEGQSDLSAFIVHNNDPTIQTRIKSPMGLQEISFGEIHFKNTLVPSSMRIGEEGQATKLFGKHFTYWRAAMASAAIGCASGAIKQAVFWLKNRTAFSRPIGVLSHHQQELSKHTAYLNMAWLLTLTAMRKIDEGLPAFIFAAMAKAEAVEACTNAAVWAMQIHGATGYTKELDLEKRVRDLFGLHSADGRTDVLRGQVARSLLGEDIYEQSLGRNRSSHNDYPLLIDELLG